MVSCPCVVRLCYVYHSVIKQEYSCKGLFVFFLLGNHLQKSIEETKYFALKAYSGFFKVGLYEVLIYSQCLTHYLLRLEKVVGKLGARRLPFTVGKTLTIDKYLIQLHFKSKISP